MAKMENLEAEAIKAYEVRYEASRKALAIKDEEESLAALEALPKSWIVSGKVWVHVIVPQNWSSNRRKHYRFQYHVDGKRAKREVAVAALQD